MEVAILERTATAITTHAVTRYNERVKPALGFETCKVELEALLKTGIYRETLPFERYGDDVEEAERLTPPDGYVELAPGIWGVLFEERGKLVMVTVLIDGACSPKRRALRQKAKRTVRRKRLRRHRGFYQGGDKKTKEQPWQ